MTRPEDEALDQKVCLCFHVSRRKLLNFLRIERPRGHEFVPQLIEAAPGLVESVSVGKPTLEDVFIRLTGQRLAAEPQ